MHCLTRYRSFMLRITRAGRPGPLRQVKPVGAADRYSRRKPAGLREPVSGPGDRLPETGQRRVIGGLSDAGLVMALALGRAGALFEIYGRQVTYVCDTPQPATCAVPQIPGERGMTLPIRSGGGPRMPRGPPWEPIRP